MASTQDFVDYICQQIGGAGEISYRKMFGEYGVYCDGKLPVMICDNMMYLKITDAGRGLLGDKAIEAPPYQGAKPSFLIENLDDSEFLSKLVRATWEELPMPKPKKKKTPKEN